MATEPSDDEEGLEVVDSSHLTDADWAEINKLKHLAQTGGQKAISEAIKELSDRDPIRYVSVMAAFFPDMIRESIRDAMAEAGMDEDDLRELTRKLESPAREQ
ncbi:hypothetical protein [Bradyrhizobium sp. 6(2017)]|uniref:hypothetical protein n=1 Tax=Bradyrhizobium sp. 6(2017) TaxID=1197460 RepID=UPI0013E12703|nr:hypothetical protein [Bradyrhizobium sp. 6(2017)]QIG91983.1 hypothetical protein G6P99_05345 [Bradyrhizobium sp. 6(2017)]